MTNQQILEKAIQKAMENGWNFVSNWYVSGRYIKWKVNKDKYVVRDAESIIFDHEFAKALWGEEDMLDGDEYIPAWQAYLRAMVIAEDPIKYLGENL